MADNIKRVLWSYISIVLNTFMKFQNYKVYSKSIETETVFMNKEMNNEWKFHYLQDTRSVQKVSRMKLFKGMNPKVNATRARTRLLRCCSTAR